MNECSVCGEPLAAESKACAVCGTSLSEPATAVRRAPPAQPAAAPALPEGELTDKRFCPDCRKPVADDYADDFCDCGGELRRMTVAEWEEVRAALPPEPEKPAAPEVAAPTAPADADDSPAPKVPPPAKIPEGLAPGTACLVVYHEKQPVLYCPLVKDFTVVGRCDPLRGDFPDVDMATLFDESLARHVSRRHLLVLRSAETGQFLLRPLSGNTGTQIEREMAKDLVDYPLTDGTRIILGGKIRMKFQILSETTT
jgi:hypothetical protein